MKTFLTACLALFVMVKATAMECPPGEECDPCLDNVSPVARARVVNALPFPSDLFRGSPRISFTMLAKNGRDARAIVDASGSTDTNGHLLHYLVSYANDDHYYTLAWTTNKLFSFRVSVGNNENTSQTFSASDDCGGGASIPFSVRAVTCRDAVWWLRGDLEEMEEHYIGTRFKHRNALYDTLYAAVTELDDGHEKRASHLIRRFQSLIRIQRKNLGPAVTQAYMTYTGAVIDGLKQRELDSLRSWFSFPEWVDP